MSLYMRLENSIRQAAAEFAISERLPKVGRGNDQPTQVWSGVAPYWTLWDGGSVELQIELSPLDPAYFGKEDRATALYVEVTSRCGQHQARQIGKSMYSDRDFDSWLRTSLRSCWDTAKEKEQTEQS